MPTLSIRHLGLGLLLTAVLPAAEPAFFTKDLKVRLAYAPTSKDQLRQASHGVGLHLGWATGIGRVGLELGYSYRTGDSYYVAPAAAAPAGKQAVDPSKSGDSRRNQLDGMHVRLGLQRELTRDLAYQAGLQIGGTRFKHEYRGDMQSVNWSGDNPDSWRDFYSGTPVEGGMKVSPFAGVTYRVSDRSSVEFNLVLSNYTALEYRHLPGSAASYSVPPGSLSWASGPISAHNGFKQDRLEKRNRVVPQLEFAYVFHF